MTRKSNSEYKKKKNEKRKIKQNIKNSPKFTLEESIKRMNDFMSIFKNNEKLREEKREQLEKEQLEKEQLEKPIIESSQNECDHEWSFFCPCKDDVSKTEYSCTKCLEHEIIETPVKKEFQYSIQPHEIKNRGKAEYHPDFRKYPAPEKAISWTGNLQKKEEIFNRCIKNKRIDSSENPIFTDTSLDNVIPLLILDENAAHPTLIRKLEEEGYDVEFLGRGLLDPQVYGEVIKKNAILVTEDEDFHLDAVHDENTHEPIYIRRDTNQLMENLNIILKHMRKFENDKQ